MGLIITDEIYTNAGVTSELYININRINIVKNAAIFSEVNVYLNKETRELSEGDIVNTRQVTPSIYFNYSEISEQLKSSTVHEILYAKLKESLESQGHTVIDDNEVGLPA